jgi:multicomponent K+:H+ antiporter subunit A
LNGFLSKEMFFDQALHASDRNSLAWAIPIVVTVGAVFSVAYSLRFIHDVFFNGEPRGLPKTPHEPPRFMKIPVDILVVLCLGVGMAPMFLVGPILSVAVAGSLQVIPPQFSLAIWHGFSLPLLMSFIAMSLGITVYYFREKLFRWHDINLPRLDARVMFNALLHGLLVAAGRITRFFDRGSLQHAASWILFTAVVAALYGFSQFDSPLLGNRTLLDIDGVTLAMVVALLLASLLTVLLHHQRLVALVTVGVVGLIISLGFVKFSAPDLALTQLSVEVVTIVLLLLALFFLPQHTSQERSRKRLSRDLIISTAAGIGVMLLAMAVMSRDYMPISGFFLDNSKPGGGGSNVVNVILVDFRGFDTMGEIVVLALAGLGIFAMLQNLRLPAPLRDLQGREWSHDPHPPIMQTLTRLLFPLMLLVAVFIFLRGHNLPGGGFIAGLIAAVALISQYLANGIAWTNARIKVDMHWVIGLGLMAAVITGVVSMLLAYPFLTSAFTYLHWPLVGKFEVASAIAFDLGVFLVVVGATVLILVELGKLSHASHHIQQQEHE